MNNQIFTLGDTVKGVWLCLAGGKFQKEEYSGYFFIYVDHIMHLHMGVFVFFVLCVCLFVQ